MDENNLERTLWVISTTELYFDRRMREYAEAGHPSANKEIYELEMALHTTLGELRHHLWEEVNGGKEKPLYSELHLYKQKKKRKKF